jgi:hypothetical protein
MPSSLGDFLIIALIIGFGYYLSRNRSKSPRTPPAIKGLNPLPRAQANLEQTNVNPMEQLGPILPQLLGLGALVAGILIGISTLSSVKVVRDCYYVGDLNIRTNCVDPFTHYYAPLGLALFLVIVGVIGLAKWALSK